MIGRTLVFLTLLTIAAFSRGEIGHPEYLFIKDITFNGNRSIPSTDLQEALGIKKGDIYDRRKLREGIDRVRALYISKGYTFMRVIKITPWVFDHDVILKITLDEGIIGKIEVIGNWRTKTEVIKRELLFREGDPYNREDALESERILRRKSYLGGADITAAFDERINAVSVTVKVIDLWTFFPFISLPISSEGNSKLILGLYDMNLFGYGQSLMFKYERESVDGVNRRIGGSFSDPRIIGTHWHLTASYFSQSIGDSWKLSLVRPLYSLKAKWSAEIKGADIHDLLNRYKGGKVVAEYHHALSTWDLLLTRSTGTRRRYNRISIWHSYREDLFTLTEGRDIIGSPKNRKLSTLGLTAMHASSEFVRDKFVDKLGDVEDIELGSSYQISLFHSDRIYGSDRNETGVSARFHSTNRMYGGYLRSEMRLKSGLREISLDNSVFSGQVRYLMKVKSQPHSLAFRLAWRMGVDPYLNRQILLGNNNGLRGYRSNRFEGEGMLLLNCEVRVLFFKTRYLVLGGVLFADMGYIWHGKFEEIEPSKIRRGIGVGLRIELPRLNGSPVYRLDVGYPLDPERGDPRRVISFGLGHLF
ncbi:TPA: hypothetical protein ENG04_02135 [Candidatus Poribacteria bacterium]|nr:hypothetical protein [Candidatus Poribacteria bacterium]HEX28862.1 hypothetical protein [Candidatus Poribacteria bacterium]